VGPSFARRDPAAWPRYCNYRSLAEASTEFNTRSIGHPPCLIICICWLFERSFSLWNREAATMNKRDRLSCREARGNLPNGIPVIESRNQKRGQKYFSDKRPPRLSPGELHRARDLGLCGYPWRRGRGRDAPLVLFSAAIREIEFASSHLTANIARRAEYTGTRRYVTRRVEMPAAGKRKRTFPRDCRVKNHKNRRSPRWDFISELRSAPLRGTNVDRSRIFALMHRIAPFSATESRPR